jgi:hypothetical protein
MTMLADRSLCHYSDTWCIDLLTQTLVLDLVRPRMRSVLAHSNYLSIYGLKLDMELRMSIASTPVS